MWPETRRRLCLIALLLIVGNAGSSAGSAATDADQNSTQPWGKPVDGLCCRLIVRAEYVVGQAITLSVELKNISNKTRYARCTLDPSFGESLMLNVVGPDGKRLAYPCGAQLGSYRQAFGPIAPGEIKRFTAIDLREYLRQLQRPAAGYIGKFTLDCRFKSPKLPERFEPVMGQYEYPTPAQVAGQWAGETKSLPVSFELKPLQADDFVVHEWGVFTVFNDVKYANVNRKEEWGNLPDFFYRQFPNMRLCWSPAAWDKPLIYFYAKPVPMNVSVRVRFAEGVPVVWWPAVVEPYDQRQFPEGDPVSLRPFRSLHWNCWLGDQIPERGGNSAMTDVANVTDFELPSGCWLKQARLPAATHVSVIGEKWPRPEMLVPWNVTRRETERFLYYDGLVPAPDYIHCDEVNDNSVTLRNRASFDVGELFVVDHREKGSVRYAFVGPDQPLTHGVSLKVALTPVGAQQWPAVGIKRLQQLLRDRGLFQPEAETVIDIWQKGLLEAEGVTVFHLLPQAEYDRMLPLQVRPAPVAGPVRVGIVRYPHLEIAPVLAERVAQFMSQLDDVKFETREQATRSLAEIGPAAIPAMRTELNSQPSLEKRHRLMAVLQSVDVSGWLPDAATVRGVAATPKATANTVSATMKFMVMAQPNSRLLILDVLLPGSIAGRQKILDIRYSMRPANVFEKNGQRYAQFRIDKFPEDLAITVDVKAEIYRHDYSTVRSNKNSRQFEKRDNLKQWLIHEQYLETYAPLIQSAAAQLSGKDEEHTLRKCFDFVLDTLTDGPYDPNDHGAVWALQQEKGDGTEFADLFITLCRAKGIPARFCEGYTVKLAAFDTPKRDWAEIYSQEYGWVPFDPFYAYLGKDTTFSEMRPIYLLLDVERRNPVLQNSHYCAYRYEGDPIQVYDAFTVNKLEKLETK